MGQPPGYPEQEPTNPRRRQERSQDDLQRTDIVDVKGIPCEDGHRDGEEDSKAEFFRWVEDTDVRNEKGRDID